MSPEKQRIAIAKACGWSYQNKHPRFGKQSVKSWYFMNTEITVSSSSKLPDYLNDLNAMHKAEKVLTYNQVFGYAQLVESFTQTTIGVGGTPLGRSFQSITSTASQRAEAFLRTIGKWEDAK